MAKILIVDDERPIRRILSVLLQEKRHRVTDVGSGEEALAAFPNVKPDVVLLDLKLPGIDGLASAVEAMRRGAFDYVAKPFDNDEMMIVDRRPWARGSASGPRPCEPGSRDRCPPRQRRIELPHRLPHLIGQRHLRLVSGIAGPGATHEVPDILTPAQERCCGCHPTAAGHITQCRRRAARSNPLAESPGGEAAAAPP